MEKTLMDVGSASSTLLQNLLMLPEKHLRSQTDAKPSFAETLVGMSMKTLSEKHLLSVEKFPKFALQQIGNLANSRDLVTSSLWSLKVLIMLLLWQELISQEELFV
jgi:hypothetical protein